MTSNIYCLIATGSSRRKRIKGQQNVKNFISCVLCLSIVVLTLVFNPLIPSVHAVEEIPEIWPLEDSFISSDTPVTIYGRRGELDVEYYVTSLTIYKYAFLKFNLSQIPLNARIVSAELRIYANEVNGTMNVGAFYCPENGWNETKMSWSNAPTLPREFLPTDSVQVKGKGYHNINITRDVQISLGARMLTEVIRPVGYWEGQVYQAKVRFFSKDGESSAPKLVVKYSTPPVGSYIVSVSVLGLPRTQSTRLAIDGVSKGLMRTMDLRVLELNGTSHEVSVDSIVLVDLLSRYYCSNSLRNCTGAGSIIFLYKIQYSLGVDSQYGDPKGAGWYDAGSMATFYVNSSVVPASGVLGVLGVKHIFEGWTGDISTPAPRVTIRINSPLTVVAVWRTDYTTIYIIVIAAISSCLGAYVLSARRKTRKLRAVAPKAEPPLPCPSCGTALLRVSHTNYVYCESCKKLYEPQ